MIHPFISLFTFLGGFLGWGLFEDRPAQQYKRLRAMADNYLIRAYLMDSFQEFYNTQRQFLRPGASPMVEWAREISSMRNFSKGDNRSKKQVVLDDYLRDMEIRSGQE